MQLDQQPRRRGWIGGLTLILVGIIFLLRNYTDWHLGNWWALVLLVPALMFFGRFWNSYQKNTRLTSEAINALIVGLLITFSAFAFLLKFNIGTLWPVFVIIIGIGFLLSAYARSMD